MCGGLRAGIDCERVIVWWQNELENQIIEAKKKINGIPNLSTQRSWHDKFKLFRLRTDQPGAAENPSNVTFILKQRL